MTISQTLATTDAGTIQLSVGWVIGVLGTMAVTISTLAGIIYNSLNKRIATQDKIIENLQDDVKRLSKGCGLAQCHFLKRPD